MGSKTYFDRNDTKVIKGVAVLLMLLHHLWGFPDRIALEGGFTSRIAVFGEPIYLYLADFAKICVSMFMFLGGYGICKSWQSGKLDLTKKLKELYIMYWKIFLVFVPIGFIFFDNQKQYCADASVCSKFSQFSIRVLLTDFLGIGHKYNAEWWFLFSYIIATLTFPLIVRFFEKKSVAVNIFWIIVFSLLMTNVFPVIGDLEIFGFLNKNLLYKTLFCQKSPYITCFWMGILMAKENLLEKMHDVLKRNKLFNPFFDVLTFVVITFLINTYSSNILDFLYVPVLVIVFLDLLSYIPLVYKGLCFVGRNSTNMWLCHSFFCYYFGSIAVWLVKPGNACLSLVMLVVISLVASIVVDCFWKFIGMLNALCQYRLKITK